MSTTPGLPKSDLVRIGGLWRNTNARGTYLSGKLGQAKLLVFENGHKADDKHPDYIMYVAPSKPPEDTPRGSSAPGGDWAFARRSEPR